VSDTNVLPEQLEKVLQQVQANADYMPDWQLEKVMRAELGSDWESNFSSFPRVPMAAASIGQVHRARLAGSDREVAVKVQFPGIHDSINSDLNNISLLLRTSAILPRGLYLNNTISVFRGELADECNYTLEADAQRKMKRFLQEAQDDFFEVPEVIDELSTERVLTTEIQPGRPLSQIKDFTQATRDKVSLA
jgi:aarF domain-containing kinase